MQHEAIGHQSPGGIDSIVGYAIVALRQAALQPGTIAVKLPSRSNLLTFLPSNATIVITTSVVIMSNLTTDTWLDSFLQDHCLTALRSAAESSLAGSTLKLMGVKVIARLGQPKNLIQWREG